MKNLTFASRWNADLIDTNYKQWLESPESLDATWQAFFEGFELARGSTAEAGISTAGGELLSSSPMVGRDAKKQARVIGAIYAFRSIGHSQALFNPLVKEIPVNPRLTLERLGLSESDLDDIYDTGNFLGGVEMPLREILDRLRSTYCGTCGAEYIHIQETAKRRWIQSKLETAPITDRLSPERKRRIWRKIREAELFEKFLHSKFVGQKRFSLEGGETLIACLDTVMEHGVGLPANALDEVVMGMAHRGRLNVLANTLGKAFEMIFREFSENYIPDQIHGDGDVKYHLGYENNIATTSGREINIRLSANPSHLEAVNPVVEGMARARQRIRQDLERKRVLPLLIHGDAAIAGQGIVAEVFNFSQLKGYRTGGTLHFVVNNQIGFTTDPSEARSSQYCTDVAKMVESPVFHINGDDPIMVAAITELALEYRQEFSQDVVIDIYCYRRHGHNEADEPAFTQPTLYRKIGEMPLTSEVLKKQLMDEGVLTAAQVEEVEGNYTRQMEDALAKVKAEEEKQKGKKRKKAAAFEGSAATFQPPYSFEPLDTGVDSKLLDQVAQALSTIPEGFHPNPKIERQLKTKAKVYESGEGIDWAFGEALAFGTLLAEGTPVRLSGQDSERGTFSQRHAVMYDINTREPYIPLLHISSDQAQFCVHNSLLSEAAVLGFDLGYSMEYPEMLGMWEAQFGDFVNGAQVIIDQFLTSSESKWGRVSGLVLLLPHGYEGQGPEHSSARLERFLAACADDNIQVCNLTTPAQYFHALRRQMRQAYRKPMVIMAPKSLLRAKVATSRVDELVKGHFHYILPDPTPPAKSASRIILCTGKVYYDLEEYRLQEGIKDVQILRVEQIYPLHREKIVELTKPLLTKSTKIVWAQEESENMGAWRFLAPQLEEIFGRRPLYAGRDASASPATGMLAVHKKEQVALVHDAFTL
jgi:2-oxoglutarate dehydrogenase E1 component